MCLLHDRNGNSSSSQAETSCRFKIGPDGGEADVRRRRRVIWHPAAVDEQNTNPCPGSQRAGRFLEIPGSDDYKLACWECGATWYGGPDIPEHEPQHRPA